ncbi:MAG: hypothetical protein Tsb0010_19220 [Parvularculaceae bacterium]
MIFEWLQQRPPRERMLVLLAGGLALLLAGYYLALAPLLAFRADARADYAYAVKTLTEVEQGVRRARPAPAAAGGAGVDLTRVINATAREHALAIIRMEPDSDGGARVWLDRADARALFAWLDALDAQYGLRATSAAIERNDDEATVSARIIFGGGDA